MIKVENLHKRFGKNQVLSDLNLTIAFQAAEKISSWISDHNIKILNITGAESLENIDVYKTAADILETAFQISLLDVSRYESTPDPHADETKIRDILGPPKNISQAVDTSLQNDIQRKDADCKFLQRKTDVFDAVFAHLCQK